MTEPASTNPHVPNSAPAASDSPTTGKACFTCGYALDGLPVSGQCPECGAPVANSLRGVLLQFAAPEYISTVLTGFQWVLWGILASIVVSVLTMAVTLVGTVAALAPAANAPFMFVATGVSTLISAFILLGYIKLTEPDPQFSGSEKPDSARHIVRITAFVQIGLALVSIILLALNGGAQPAGFLSVKSILSILAGFAGTVAWAVQYFAMMKYIAWLGRRVPDAYVVSRTKTYMWLLPVLTTVGIVLIGLGPLIALIMYWNLLDRVRKHLKAIRETGEPAKLPGMSTTPAMVAVATPAPTPRPPTAAAPADAGTNQP